MRDWEQKGFIGGHPTLDFVNTVDDQDRSRKVSRIASWDDFLGWASVAGMFSADQQVALGNQALRSDAGKLMQHLHRVRETQYEALARIASGDRSPGPALLALEAAIRQSIGRSKLQAQQHTYAWVPDMNQADWVSDRLMLSLESLLRSEEILRLKQCGRCSWLFLNKGRGKGRRWCDMSTCGNRAKLESFRSRDRG